MRLLDSLFVASYDSQGYGEGILIGLHTGNVCFYFIGSVFVLIRYLDFVVVVVEKNTTAQKSDAQSLLAVQVLQLQLING
jgi:hypothetical protein